MRFRMELALYFFICAELGISGGGLVMGAAAPGVRALGGAGLDMLTTEQWPFVHAAAVAVAVLTALLISDKT